MADSPSSVVFKSRLSKRDALPQPGVTGFHRAIAGGEQCPALQRSQWVPSVPCGSTQIPAALPGRALHPSHPTCPRAANSCTRMSVGPLWELGDRHGRSIPAHLLPAQLMDPGRGWDQESSRHTWRGSGAKWSHTPLASIPGRRAGGQDPCYPLGIRCAPTPLVTSPTPDPQTPHKLSRPQH